MPIIGPVALAVGLYIGGALGWFLCALGAYWVVLYVLMYIRARMCISPDDPHFGHRHITYRHWVVITQIIIARARYWIFGIAFCVLIARWLWHLLVHS